MAKMTFAAYAKHRGVSAPTITQAVKGGRISVEVDPKTNRRVIDSEKADVEWNRNVDAAKQAGPNAAKARAAAARGEPAVDGGDGPGSDESGGGAALPQALDSSGVALVVSRARREFYMAEVARLNFEQRAGSLVAVDEVQRRAFSIARTVREALFNIPDRLASQLAGETDPRRVHLVLTTELTRALEALADGA